MRLRFLGSTSEAGACPSLYETDRGTVVVQGLTLTDPEARADLRDILDGESAVEVPRELLVEVARAVLGEPGPAAQDAPAPRPTPGGRVNDHE
ncbi:hypothetical protein [Sphaerisporangium fuscum]|uniref:hypothetical protein n=1 Tax=Sphaerisporangium fuscum TaxID=2835868 RepID=UPI001BDCF225|nr:hypothetical protein [Sphaerisporangium fuscum]